MSAAADKILRKATFCYRCRGVQLVGGNPYLMDSGPHGLHAVMTNFVAPAYGVVTMPNGRCGVQFNGTTQYASLPLSFYDHAPTDTMTFVWYCKFGSGLAVNEALFNCRNAGITAGYLFYRGNVNLLSLNGVDSLGVAQLSENPAPINGRLDIGVCSAQWAMQKHAWWHNRQKITAVDAADRAAFLLDATFVPLIARFGAAYMGMTLCAFALFPWAFTDREAKDITDMLVSGVL